MSTQCVINDSGCIMSDYWWIISHILWGEGSSEKELLVDCVSNGCSSPVSVSLLCLYPGILSTVLNFKKYNSLWNSKSPFVCFLTKHRHGLCCGFRQAEVCLRGKPLKITTWENYKFQTIALKCKTWHGKQKCVWLLPTNLNTQPADRPLCFVSITTPPYRQENYSAKI